ncbi:asparagine synthase-related protein [Clostridium beijerinckii]|uniref:asparagine synthase (glutamine-hydrolyzing) n=1 Tax=Clostridium beijerinckii TaxID=1520 RepID=A0A7X9XS55_CLOBE|nr:asparagine synthase-related protein [Clostridium beijerinckii]NMF07940.1 hypothetical protein [Clostridium beijerinckii]
MKWYYGGINIEKQNYDINEKLNLYYNIKRKFYVNKYSTSNTNYFEATNNEEIREKVNGDNLILLGDINIKNVQELKEKYNLGNKNNYEVVKFLYESYGINFTNHLYGGFSLVIIDYIKNKIYLIRDQLGEKELYWGIRENKIFFGSDLFLIDDFYNKTMLNSEYFKLYCENLAYTDFTLTPYKNIFRVNSASYIEINMDNFKYSENKYWRLELVEEKLNLKNEEEYVDKFKQLLVNSINDSAYENKYKALALSGGLDSTAIFAMTRKYTNSKVKPYCAVFEELSVCDERQYIDETMKMYNQEYNYIKCDDCGVLVNYPEDYFYTSEPHINVLNKKFVEKLYSKIQEDNIQVLYDGFFADHILTGNIIFLLDKRVSRKEKWRIIDEFAGTMNLNFVEILYRYLILPKIDRGYIPEIDHNLLKTNRSDLVKVRKYSNKEMVLQLKAISSKLFGDKEVAPRYNIERVHPFIDRRIIEFLYCIPGELKLNGQMSKYILRQAVKDIVPRAIVKRINKTQHVELTQKGLRDNWNKIFNKLKVGRITKIPYITITKEEWIEELLKFRSGQIPNDKMYIYLSLEVWLQQVEDKYGNLEFE